MIRGTTPTIIFNTNMSLADATAVEIMIGQCGKAIHTITLPRVVISGNRASVELTQEETLALSANLILELQIRILKDGKAIASKIKRVTIDTLLKDEVIA